MTAKSEFKKLECTWSYIRTCTYVICPSCKRDMKAYAEEKLDDDNIDFGDFASCSCGNNRFDGVHPGLNF